MLVGDAESGMLSYLALLLAAMIQLRCRRAAEVAVVVDAWAPYLVIDTLSMPPSSETEPNPYELLGISQDATETEIRSAYRARSLKVHPDRVRLFQFTLHPAPSQLTTESE